MAQPEQWQVSSDAAEVYESCLQSLAAESERALAEFVVSSGEIVMPIAAHIVTASRR